MGGACHTEYCVQFWMADFKNRTGKCVKTQHDEGVGAPFW